MSFFFLWNSIKNMPEQWIKFDKVKDFPIKPGTRVFHSPPGRESYGEGNMVPHVSVEDAEQPLVMVIWKNPANLPSTALGTHKNMLPVPPRDLKFFLEPAAQSEEPLPEGEGVNLRQRLQEQEATLRLLQQEGLRTKEVKEDIERLRMEIATETSLSDEDRTAGSQRRQTKLVQNVDNLISLRRVGRDDQTLRKDIRETLVQRGDNDKWQRLGLALNELDSVLSSPGVPTGPAVEKIRDIVAQGGGGRGKKRKNKKRKSTKRKSTKRKSAKRKSTKRKTRVKRVKRVKRNSNKGKKQRGKTTKRKKSSKCSSR